VPPAVEEEGRCAGDAAQVGAVDVVGDARSAYAFPEVVRETLGVESELLDVTDQIVPLERVLVVEQKIVHLPEGALRGGGLRGFRGLLRVWVDVVQRQVPPHVLDVAEVGEELADDRLCLATVRALEVAILDDRDTCVERSSNVVTIGVHLEVQVGKRFRGAEECTPAQWTRQVGRGLEEQPRERRCADRRAQDADLRLVELPTAEGKGRDQERDGESDPGDRAAARDCRQPMGGRSRPRLNRVTIQVPPRIPMGFPSM
jgi:hypothetical protein